MKSKDTKKVNKQESSDKKSVEISKLIKKNGADLTKNNNKYKILAILLGTLFVLAIVYIGWNSYANNKLLEQQQIFVSGTRQGAQNTVKYLFDQGSKCQSTSIVLNNQTMNMLPVECIFLQASKSQCKPFSLVIENQTLGLINVACLNQKSGNAKN